MFSNCVVCDMNTCWINLMFEARHWTQFWGSKDLLLPNGDQKRLSGKSQAMNEVTGCINPITAFVTLRQGVRSRVQLSRTETWFWNGQFLALACHILKAIGLAVNFKYLGNLYVHSVTCQIFCYILVPSSETMSYERRGKFILQWVQKTAICFRSTFNEYNII